MDGLFQQVDQLKGVEVTSPFDPADGWPADQPGRHRSASLSSTCRTAASPQYQSLANKIRDLGDKVDVQGLQIEYGGDMFGEFELPASEMLGILAAVIILLLAFGSVLAMGLPIGTALFGLGIGHRARRRSSATCSRCPTSRRSWRR